MSERDPMIEIGKIKLPPTFGQMADGKPFGHDDRDATILGLREALSLANARNADLEAIVNRLPKTADGKPIEIGMSFWRHEDTLLLDGEPWEGWIITGIGAEQACERQHFDWVRTNGIGWLTTQMIYSTREAALSALKESANG